MSCEELCSTASDALGSVKNHVTYTQIGQTKWLIPEQTNWLEQGGQGWPPKTISWSMGAVPDARYNTVLSNDHPLVKQ